METKADQGEIIIILEKGLLWDYKGKPGRWEILGKS